MFRSPVRIAFIVLLSAAAAMPALAAPPGTRPEPRRFTVDELRAFYQSMPEAHRRAVEEAIRERLEPVLRGDVAAWRARRQGGPGAAAPSPLPGWGSAVTVNTAAGEVSSGPMSFAPLESSTPLAGAIGTLAVDGDLDGLDDGFESKVASLFTPLYFVSTGERSGTGFARFGDFLPQTVTQTFPAVPPISHYRVHPLGFANDATGTQFGFLEVDYLTLWNRDDGLSIGGDCRFFASLLGGVTGFAILQLADAIDQGHDLDNERSAVLVAAPTSGFQYNTSPTAYALYSFYTAGHEGTFFDTSAFGFPSPPVPAGNHLIEALSRSKHATYTFNPDHLPLFPSFFIADVNFTLSDLYFAGFLTFDDYSFYLAVSDFVFFSCVVEHFGDQGGTTAGTNINVGEIDHTLNGSGFINGGQLRDKLSVPLWILQ